MALNAQQMVDLYMQAEADVLAGKEITFNGRKQTMEDLDKIRAGRIEWERRVASQQRGGRLGYSLASFS